MAPFTHLKEVAGILNNIAAKNRTALTARIVVDLKRVLRFNRTIAEAESKIRIRIGYLYRHLVIDLSKFTDRHSALLIARAYELSGAAR